MNLLVVRHAEADHNIHNMANDASSDVSNLTEKGKLQAAELAMELKEREFDVVLTSELPRTIATAEILMAGRNIPTIRDARLNDIVTGMSGKPFDEFRQLVNTSEDSWNFHTELGESFNDEKRRTTDFLEYLKTLPYENVLIVTHGGVANMIYGLVHNHTNAVMFGADLKNCGTLSIKL